VRGGGCPVRAGRGGQEQEEGRLGRAARRASAGPARRPPSALSRLAAASLSPAPGAGAGASAALPGGRPPCGARARLHRPSPLGLTASRLGHTGRGSSFEGFSVTFLLATRPLRLARAKVGGASRATHSHGAASAPARAPSPTLSSGWRQGVTPPSRQPPLRGAAGRHAPARRASPPPAPLSGGPPDLRWGTAVESGREKIF